jgi:L-2-hydroxyglutarate oxidase
VLEKETSCGQHASARNSGVLHAGFYYTADSLKARFTQQGNRAWTEYCLDRKLPMNRCGKLVVCRNEKELEQLRVLRERGRANGVPLEELDAKQAKELEPRVKTFERALYSPTTSTLDPGAVMTAKKEEARQMGIEIHEGTAYVKKKGAVIETTQGDFEAGYVVNCAGLYADRVARDFGFSKNYRILPFKGLYLYSSEPAEAFRMHIYPVPDLDYPFLGVHVTVTVDKRAKIGPTAIPAFWREQYAGWDNFKFEEMMEIMFREAGLFLFSGFDFAKLAAEEMRKYSKKVLAGLASEIAEGIDPSHYEVWGKPGIRAQLVDLKKRKLEMDFVVQSDGKSCHVLNAVSPGLTCAIPFSKYVCDQIEAQLSSRTVPAGEMACRS